jgi:hypothetical protein
MATTFAVQWTQCIDGKDEDGVARLLSRVVAKGTQNKHT